MASILNDTSMLVELNLRCPTWRRKDKKITAEVAEQHGVDIEVGTYNKKTMWSPECELVEKLMADTRAMHRKMTRSWSEDSNIRLIRASNFMLHKASMQVMEDAIAKAIERAKDTYAQRRDEAMMKLGAMYDPEDYPDPSSFDKMYRMKVGYMPVPDTDHWIKELADDVVGGLKSQLEQQLAEAETLASKENWRLLYDAVAKFAKHLNKDSNAWQNSVMEGIHKVCDVLTNLNVTNDPKLEQARQELEANVLIFNPEDVRKDGAVKDKVRNDVNAILNNMEGAI